jgi:histidinol-phosphate/aromatic aminotransferase/cobyric acid decarboxylase-like protein
VIAAMRAQQTPWSVSTPALAAITACLSPAALAMSVGAAEEIGRRRDVLVESLAEAGLLVAGTPAAPFVLVDTSGWEAPDQQAGWVRHALREAGFAVRRGETFPGLGMSWIRIAVRDVETTRALAEALRGIRSLAGAG